MNLSDYINRRNGNRIELIVYLNSIQHLLFKSLYLFFPPPFLCEDHTHFEYENVEGALRSIDFVLKYALVGMVVEIEKISIVLFIPVVNQCSVPNVRTVEDDISAFISQLMQQIRIKYNFIHNLALIILNQFEFSV